MVKGILLASLALAASVLAASGSQPFGGSIGARGAISIPTASAAAVPPTVSATREFQFRGLVFTVPTAWSVQRADRLPFRPEYVSVTGRPSGPRLMFSDSIQFVACGSLSGRDHSRGGLSLDRFEMPNPMTRGVVYLFPEAGVSISAQVRTDAESRAADAVAQSARRALPRPGAVRS